MQTINSYEDARRAEAYARLEFPGTYYLAYRDLPAILSEHIAGKRAMDFGCGAGRSTRFLRNLGFDAIGVDISRDMIRKAREIDPGGDYRLLGDGGVAAAAQGRFDLVLSAFTFDNIPAMDRKIRLFRDLRGLLESGGAIVNLVSAPEIYTHEWASFSTRDYPENRRARSGDRVKIVITDIDDPRPVEDFLWTDEDYREIYRRAGLEPAATHHPLGREDEPYEWVNETKIAPWAIYVLKKSGD